MRNPTLQRLVASVGTLATLPSTVVLLLDLLKDTTCAATEVVKIMERDPVMTANVLKLSNSAFYGARREISSLQSALVMLGNRAVVTLAFAASMAPILRRELVGYGFTRQRFWDHALRTATASATLADETDQKQLRCEAFTAGLIHDIGMLIIDEHLVATGREIKPCTPPFAVCAAERDLLGFDHAEAGGALASHWGFPPQLIAPIALHHGGTAEPEHVDLVRLVRAGQAFSRLADSGYQRTTDAEAEATIDAMGLPDDLVQQLRLDLAGDLNETSPLATRPVANPV